MGRVVANCWKKGVQSSVRLSRVILRRFSSFKTLQQERFWYEEGVRVCTYDPRRV